MTLKFHVERLGYIFLYFKHATRLADPWCYDFVQYITSHIEVIISFVEAQNFVSYATFWK